MNILGYLWLPTAFALIGLLCYLFPAQSGYVLVGILCTIFFGLMSFLGKILLTIFQERKEGRE